uniref:Uncharacterized protein n=1 Tax=Arundo donax TaxID=35708 RepID=A0A0A9F385_ARUDO
MASISTPSW